MYINDISIRHLIAMKPIGTEPLQLSENVYGIWVHDRENVYNTALLLGYDCQFEKEDDWDCDVWGFFHSFANCMLMWHCNRLVDREDDWEKHGYTFYDTAITVLQEYALMVDDFCSSGHETISDAVACYERHVSESEYRCAH